MFDCGKLFIFLLYAHLIYHIKSICQNSQYHIEQEKRADENEQYAEENSHPPDV